MFRNPNFHLFLFLVPAPRVTKWTQVSVTPYPTRGGGTTRLPWGNNLHFITGQENRLVREKAKGNGGWWRDRSTGPRLLLRRRPQPQTTWTT